MTKNSKILILGSFPSVKSREVNFFYGHPQNRFWPLMARVLGCAVPQSIEEKKAMLLSNGVALWDVLDSCDIAGSSDSSIRNAVPVDIALILRAADIRRIYCNGTAAYELFIKHLAPRLRHDAGEAAVDQSRERRMDDGQAVRAMETDTHRLKETHMKHCIIAKFNDSVDDKAAMITRIDKLFAPAPAMDGIHGCTVLRNCIDRENRYDLAIVIDMDKAALPAWDASELHREWKKAASALISRPRRYLILSDQSIGYSS